MDFKVTGVAKSDKMVLNYDGLEVGTGDTACGAALLASATPPRRPRQADQLPRDRLQRQPRRRRLHRLAGGGRHVPEWLSKGIHVVTANKKGGSGPIELYEACKRASRSRSQWYYETTGPGSGLPVLARSS